MNIIEKEPIEEVYKKVLNQEKEEFILDSFWKIKCIVNENGKKMVETKEWKKMSLKMYLAVNWPKSEEHRKNMSLSKLKLDDEMKAKICYAYELWWTEEEKANFMGITRMTLYNRKKDYPEFFELVERLGTEQDRLARQNILNSLKDGDIETSKWYLERKRSKEFGKNINVEVNTNIRNIIEQESDKLNNLSDKEKDNIIMWIIQEPEALAYND